MSKEARTSVLILNYRSGGCVMEAVVCTTDNREVVSGILLVRME